MNSFLNDDFLTLLYFSQDAQITPMNPRLEPIKQALGQIANQKLPRYVRAHAAITLGRFVQAKNTDYQSLGNAVRQSKPELWFRHARVLGSVIGAWEYAKALLNEYQQYIDFDPNVDSLPRVYTSTPPDNERIVSERVDSAVRQAWLLGARTSLRHMQRRFKGWSKEEFNCSFACIVNYLTILSTRKLGQHSSSLEQNRQALIWIDPLWKQLIEVAPTMVAADQAAAQSHQAFLIEQRLVVLTHMNTREERDSASLPWGSAKRSVGIRNPQNTHAQEPNNTTDMAAKVQLSAQAHQKVVIIKGPIAPSTEKDEKSVIEQFKTLHLEVPLTVLPELETLWQIEVSLMEEFPWAKEAIGLVMDDLLARRHHGSLRLGLAPLLLVGPPGSGKTRFAKRLGDHLNTPNTIINLAGMADTKLLKGCTRGWAGARSSRVVEFIQQTFIGNPLFVLDEIDKASEGGLNSGDPQAALLDLLEPGNAARYQDIFLLTECDLSHCLYVATANSLQALSAPLLSRLRPVFFPKPDGTYAPALIKGVLRDLEISWCLPAGTLNLTEGQMANLKGLSPREMRAAMLTLLARNTELAAYVRH